MIIDNYVRNKILGSSNVTQYTTQCYTVYSPIDRQPPFVILQSIGWDKHWKNQKRIFSINSYSFDKEQVELLNNAIYNLFDTSTAYIKESSSNLYIDSVTIINNSASLYDDTNKHYQRVLDVAFWYH